MSGVLSPPYRLSQVQVCTGYSGKTIAEDEGWEHPFRGARHEISDVHHGQMGRAH